MNESDGPRLPDLIALSAFAGTLTAMLAIVSLVAGPLTRRPRHAPHGKSKHDRAGVAKCRACHRVGPWTPILGRSRGMPESLCDACRALGWRYPMGEGGGLCAPWRISPCVECGKLVKSHRSRRKKRTRCGTCGAYGGGGSC